MITYGERARQRVDTDGKEPRVEHEYWFSGSDNRTDIMLAVGLNIPRVQTLADIDGVLFDVFLTKVMLDELGGGNWDVKVTYSGAADKLDVAMTVGVSNQKIFQSLETIGTYDCINGGYQAGSAEFNDIPDFGGAIGVNGQDVQGVDVEVGAVDISITRSIDLFATPATYFQTLIDMVTPRTVVNHAQWVFRWLQQELTFPKGSLRFRGAPIKWDAQWNAEITYHLRYQRGITLADDFTVGGSDEIETEGWQYIWIKYEQAAAAGGQIVKMPTAVKIEKVYPYANFDQLDLP